MANDSETPVHQPQQQQQRRGSQHRRYLASLVADNNSAVNNAPLSSATVGVTTPNGKPFSVALSYTLPKRRTTSPRAPGSAPPISTSGAAVANGGAGGMIDRPASPTAVQRYPAPPPPPRRHSAVSGSSDFAPTVARKMALQQKEEDYDGSEASFISLLMQRLRAQCDALASGEEGAVSPDAAMSSDVAQKEADRTLWSIVEARNRPSLVRRLPVEILITIFEFSGIADLCRVDAVSRRLHVVVSSPVLWLAHCKRYRLTVERTGAASSFPSARSNGGGGAATTVVALAADPKEVVRDYVLLARRSLTDRLAEEQQTLENLERRLNDRVEHVAPFSTAFVEENTNQPRLVRLLQHAEQQLTDISRMVNEAEAARAELVSIAHANRTLLERQQVELHQWKRRALPSNGGQGVILHHGVLGSGHDHAATNSMGSTVADGGQRLLLSGGITRRSTTSSVGGSSAEPIIPASLLHVYSGGGNGQGNAASQGSGQGKNSNTNVVLTAKAIESFERRVVRTVLAAASELPLIIRRGTTTFSALELLSIQLRGGSSDSGAGAKIDARWKRWKSFFPLGSDYMNLCDAVYEQQHHPMSGEHVAAVDTALFASPCAAIVRKVLCMTDAEIEECALQ